MTQPDKSARAARASEIELESRDRAMQAPVASTLVLWLDRLIILWLFILTIAAPHSIAATQIAWMCGMLVWLLRFLIKPRPRLRSTPVDYLFLGFILLTVISSFASYDPDVSIAKLRATSLFTIVYLVAENVTSRRVLRLLVLALVASCSVNVVYTIVERAVGRGVKIGAVAPESPLATAMFTSTLGVSVTYPLQAGDTILEINGRKIRNPDELVATLNDGWSRTGSATLKVYRAEYEPTVLVPRGHLLDGNLAKEKLGISSWSRGRDWRASGFYGQYVTYAEVLQLIASIAFALFIAIPRKRSWKGALLIVVTLAMTVALLLTVTRASQAAFLLSALVIVSVGANRRTVVVVTACALPLILAGLVILQQKRNVSFFDRNDGSITWRTTVWREGLHLLVSSPRHMAVGVGMDSIKRHWREWGLFDGGKIPVGHMHSTPLQIALERGIPALLMWLALVFVYARMLWRLASGSILKGWIERGLVLGALGGLVGFFASGLVHYNLGDSEVVMVFYLVMGLCLSLERLERVEGNATAA